MKHTNINIESPKGQMKYYIEYLGGQGIVSEQIVYRFSDPNTVEFYDERTNIQRVGNEWIPASISDVRQDYSGFIVGRTQLSHAIGDFKVSDRKKFFYVGITELPNPLGCNLSATYIHHSSVINIYFPRFSVDTYEKGIKYAIILSTWIHGKEVRIGSYLVDRNDVIACSHVKKFANEEYYEYISLPIVDPWYLIYGSEWRSFRQKVCGEPDDNGYELNSTGSIINVTLHPVKISEDGIYREVEDYHGGQNSINLADEVTDYLSFNIGDNRDINNYYENRLLIGTELKFNEEYSQDLDGLKEYLYETYRIKDFSMKMEIVIQDESDIYSYMKMDVDTPWQEFDTKKLTDEHGNHPFLFDSWEGYTEGMFINIFLHIIPNNTEEEEPTIYLKSNRILLTPGFFRYLVGNENDINKVFLEAVDMKVYNINAVHKVEQQVIQMERPDDYKANIIKPVFFRTRDLGNLIIHPEVTEQVCINLDSYKSKVSSFILKIEGISFVEYGRNHSGVIFKVIGSKLPGVVPSGIYYIMNENSELITTGKYTYER